MAPSGPSGDETPSLELSVSLARTHVSPVLAGSRGGTPRRPWLGLHQLPNTICIVRVIVVYFALYQIGTQYEREGRWALGWLAAIIVAALTDRLDGFLAKRYGWTSALGAFLDQISDKLVTLGIFAFLAMHGAFPAISLGALVLRELFVSALRVSANRVGVPIRTGQAGRFKTFTQQVASLFIFLHFAFPAPWLAGFTMAQWMLWAGWLVFVAIVLGFGMRAVRAFRRVYTVERVDAAGRTHRSYADLVLVVLTLALIPLPAAVGGSVVVLLITLGTGVTYTWSFVWGARVKRVPWRLATVFTLAASALVSSGLVLVLKAEPRLNTLWLLVAGVSFLWVVLLAASAKTARAYIR